MPSSRLFMRHSAPQAGLTLVELLVAMTLGLLIALVAAGALLIARQGFTSVDAASQLRDNGRYIQDLVYRLGIQAGYKNVFFMKAVTATSTGLSTTPPPHVFGINNAKRSSSTQLWDESSAWGSSETGKNSDILVLRAQVSTAAEASTASDQSMIDCLGVAPTAVPIDRDDRFVSILHIQSGSADGEPSLMCTRFPDSGGPDTQPLIQGVENFQVLYGVDGVAPGNTTVPITTTADSIPERYLRADQLTVAGNQSATYANWRRVRSLRVGLVLRARTGSSVATDAETFYPLGIAPDSATGTTGSAFANNSTDPGTVFSPGVDGRLRQVITFTVHLRNFQELETN